MKFRTLLTLVALMLVLLAAPGRACCCKLAFLAPTPVPDRVARADAVVIGKVISIEAQNLWAVPFLGAKQKIEYQVAVVRVEEILGGIKGLTHIRIGFYPNGAPVIAESNPASPSSEFGTPHRRQAAPLLGGQRACFFLKSHCLEPFFVVSALEDVIDKNDVYFDRDVTLAKFCLQLLEDPDASLKSKNPADRFTTAAMLITRYQTVKSSATRLPKTEPIPAERSKFILEALANADWAKEDPVTHLSPRAIFNRLHLTNKDGWKPQDSPTPGDYVAFATKWLKNNATTYRVLHVVHEPSVPVPFVLEKSDLFGSR